MAKIVLGLALVAGLVYAGINFIDWDTFLDAGWSEMDDDDGVVADVEPEPRRSSAYPITRTITSADGRSLDVTIIGKSGGTLYLRRSSDDREFELTREKLSASDALYVAALPDGGVFRADPNRRAAKWFQSVDAAKQEAARRRMPIYLFFNGSGW